MIRFTRIVTPASRSLSTSTNHSGTPAPPYGPLESVHTPVYGPVEENAAVAEAAPPPHTSLSYFTHPPSYPVLPHASRLSPRSPAASSVVAPSASPDVGASPALSSGGAAHSKAWRGPPSFARPSPRVAAVPARPYEQHDAAALHSAAASSPSVAAAALYGPAASPSYAPAGRHSSSSSSPSSSSSSLSSCSSSPLLPGSVWEPLAQSTTIWGADIVPRQSLIARFQQHGAASPFSWPQSRQYALWGWGGDEGAEGDKKKKQQEEAEAAEAEAEASREVSESHAWKKVEKKGARKAKAKRTTIQGIEEDQEAARVAALEEKRRKAEAAEAAALEEEARLRAERHRAICAPKINLHDSTFEVIRDNILAHLESMDHTRRALPRIQRVNVLIKKVETPEQWKEMVGILHDLLERDQEWDRHTLGSLIAAAQRTGEEKHLVSMLQNPLKYRLWPTTGLLNKMAWKLFQVPEGRHVHAAMHIFNLYPPRGCPRNKETFEMYLRGLAKHRALHLGLDVAKEAIEASMIRDAPSWRRALLTTLAAGEPALGEQWYEGGVVEEKFRTSANVTTAVAGCKIVQGKTEPGAQLIEQTVGNEGADKTAMLFANVLDMAKPQLSEEEPAIGALEQELPLVEEWRKILTQMLPQCDANKEEVQAVVERLESHVKRVEDAREEEEKRAARAELKAQRKAAKLKAAEEEAREAAEQLRLRIAKMEEEEALAEESGVQRMAAAQ